MATNELMVRGGLTYESLALTVQNDRAQAEQVGYLFRARQEATLETRPLGTYEVQGNTDSVNYGRTGSRDVGKQMQGGPTMVPGGEYAIGASGVIDKNGATTAFSGWGGNVSPTDRTDDGRTRLQVAVVGDDGQVIRSENYTPGSDGKMRLQTRPGEEGATLGFYMLDGVNDAERADNLGQFNVSVDETRRIQRSTAIAIRANDAEGVLAAGEQIARQFETAPEAASLPTPDTSLAVAAPGTGIIRDPVRDELSTTDGYRFQFNENRIAIYAPGRDEAVTTFNGRDVRESDGTQWRAENGNFIAPNGAMLHLEYDGDNIRRAELIHGDTRVNVRGAGLGDGVVQLGPATGGGFDRRQELVEGSATDRTYRLGGHFNRKDDLDVTWSVEQSGANLGVVTDAHDPSRDRVAVERRPYYVDPDMRPAFATQDYERMLRSEIEDQRSIIAGLGQAEGQGVSESRAVADYLLGPASGQYERYASELQASRDTREGAARQVTPEAQQQLLQQYLEQEMMQQIFGGLPQQFESFPAAMQALQQLVQVLAAQQSMQSDFQQGASNLRSYIPSVAAAQQSQVSPDMLVDQALRGLANRNGGARDPLQKFDINSGRDYAARRVGRDPGAELLARRMQDTSTSRTDGTKPMSKELEMKATKLAMGIHDAIDGGGTTEEALTRLLAGATPEEKAALKIVYPKMFGESVEDAITGDTSFNYQSTLVGMLNSTARSDNTVDLTSAAKDAATLNEAMRSDWWNPGTWGTSDDKLQEIMTNRSPAELKTISQVYEQTYGESLRTAITDDTSGHYRDALLAQLDKADGAKPNVVSADPAESEAVQAAQALNHAVRGAGTDNQKLVDVLSSLSNEGKAKLRDMYPKMYGESLEDAIKGDTNDHWDLDFQNHLLALVNNNRSTATVADDLKATQNAAQFRAAVTTWDGTDEATLDRLMTTLSPAEIKRMAQIYQSTYGESLASAISDDTSGWHETALLHQLNNLK